LQTSGAAAFPILGPELMKPSGPLQNQHSLGGWMQIRYDLTKNKEHKFNCFFISENTKF
jgi:hypothetical protein